MRVQMMLTSAAPSQSLESPLWRGSRPASGDHRRYVEAHERLLRVQSWIGAPTAHVLNQSRIGAAICNNDIQREAKGTRSSGRAVDDQGARDLVPKFLPLGVPAEHE